MTYEEYVRDLRAKKLKEDATALFESKTSLDWFERVDELTKSLNSTEKPVKSANLKRIELINAKLARKSRKNGSKKPTESTHNPNKAYRHHKIRKELDSMYLDIPDDDNDIL